MMSNWRKKLLRFIVHHSSFIVLLAWLINADVARSCPFCVAVKPTLVQQREAAEVAFLGECVALPTSNESGNYDFAVRRQFSGESPQNSQGTIAVQLDEAVKPGTLALVLGERDADRPTKLRWRCVPLGEVGFAYVAAAPDLRTAAPKRLAYFARFLEHADPLVAEDAYLEFGHAPFDVVAQSASALNVAKLRGWIVDPAVPAERKGFYGLALGLTAESKERAANLAVLEKLIATDAKPGSDFRAGFDGVLGGYLMATGRQGIDFITKRFLANPNAAVGDVRHAHKALRFYHEFGPAEHRPAIASAVEQLLNRPADAAAAITDLARWQHWSALDRIVALYDQQDFAAPDIRRAIVGYLRVCPLPAAEQSLDDLRRRDPKSIAAAEVELETLTGR